MAARRCNWGNGGIARVKIRWGGWGEGAARRCNWVNGGLPVLYLCVIVVCVIVIVVCCVSVIVVCCGPPSPFSLSPSLPPSLPPSYPLQILIILMIVFINPNNKNNNKNRGKHASTTNHCRLNQLIYILFARQPWNKSVHIPKTSAPIGAMEGELPCPFRKL